ncbi:MAG: FHA domain-containing protein [Planctomycetota bacterium]
MKDTTTSSAPVPYPTAEISVPGDPTPDEPATVLETIAGLPAEAVYPTGQFPHLALRISDGSRAGESMRMTNESRIFGRSPECDVSFDAQIDRLVSGRHARIEFREGVLRITDLDSTNGTFLDGQRIRGTVIVHARSILSLGCAPEYAGTDGGVTIELSPYSPAPLATDGPGPDPDLPTVHQAVSTHGAAAAAGAAFGAAGGLWGAMKDGVRQMRERRQRRERQRELDDALVLAVSDYRTACRVLGATARTRDWIAVDTEGPAAEVRHRVEEEARLEQQERDDRSEREGTLREIESRREDVTRAVAAARAETETLEGNLESAASARAATEADLADRTADIRDRLDALRREAGAEAFSLPADAAAYLAARRELAEALRAAAEEFEAGAEDALANLEARAERLAAEEEAETLALEARAGLARLEDELAELDERRRMVAAEAADADRRREVARSRIAAAWPELEERLGESLLAEPAVGATTDPAWQAARRAADKVTRIRAEITAIAVVPEGQ